MGTSGAVQFIMLSTPRTGTNLIIEMLNSHPDCLAGYELFSEVDIENNHLAWYLDEAIPNDLALCELRRADPVSLIEELHARSIARGFKASGFKLMYYQAVDQPAVRDYLLQNSAIRVIHVKRHNRLRRLVSLRQAMASGNWRVVTGQKIAPQPVRLALEEIAWDIAEVKKHELEYGVLDDTHRVLHLYYEEMVQDLPGTARQLFDFLGLRPWSAVKIDTQKTGTATLRQSIANYAELQEQIAELLSHFD
jgi:LPS sulfotransferase NodH